MDTKDTLDYLNYNPCWAFDGRLKNESLKSGCSTEQRVVLRYLNDRLKAKELPAPYPRRYSNSEDCFLYYWDGCKASVFIVNRQGQVSFKTADMMMNRYGSIESLLAQAKEYSVSAGQELDHMVQLAEGFIVGVGPGRPDGHILPKEK